MSKALKRAGRPKAIPGYRIITAAKMRTSICGSNEHADGPGYNDHSGSGDHNKAGP